GAAGRDPAARAVSGWPGSRCQSRPRVSRPGFSRPRHITGRREPGPAAEQRLRRFRESGVDHQPAGRPRRGKPAGLRPELGRVTWWVTGRAAVTLRSPARRALGALAAVAVVMLSLGAAAAQLTYKTPAEAFSALIAAARSDDIKALISVLGPEGESFVVSDDPVADRHALLRFVTAYDKANRIE